MNAFWKYKLDHVLFWSLTIGFHAYSYRGLFDEAGTQAFVLELLVRDTLLAVTIYTVLLQVIPRLEQRAVVSGLLLLVIVMTGYVLLKDWHDAHHYAEAGDGSRNFLHNSLYNASIVTFYLAFSVTLHLSKQWYLQRALIRKIEIEKLHTELEYLKAQINPHFLFNSINTVYFQIDKQNTSARETLSSLASMLRYQLYECTGDQVPIEREINYLQNYVALQRARKDDHYRITFHADETLQHFMLPPLLLIPFVENAFKHVSSYTDRPNLINIHASLVDDWFSFTVENTVNARTASCPESGGIGMKNVTRRLELLYGNNFRLDVNKATDVFQVSLKLKPQYV